MNLGDLTGAGAGPPAGSSWPCAPEGVGSLGVVLL